MFAGKFRRSASPLALTALMLPLAALVPLASPLDRQQAASLGLPASAAVLGSAEAATMKKVVRKKIARKPAATKRVCSKVKVRGKLVTRCRTVKVVPKQLVVPPPPPVVTPLQPIPAPIPAPVQVVQPVYVAPPPSPPPPPAPVAIPAAAFFWIDQADSYAQALGDSPPDYAFKYDGIECWAWVSRGGEVLVVEPGRDGVVQYYFGAGESAPYLVRDSDYSYAFDGAELTQVYDNRGRIWTSALTSRQRYDSHDLRERGRALYSASLRQRRWDAGSAFDWNNWYASTSFYNGWNNGWNGVWRENKDWPILRDRWNREHPRRRLEEERRHRREARDGFHTWRRDGGRGAPPPTGNPQVTAPPSTIPGGAPAPAPTADRAPAPVVSPPTPPAPQPMWRPRRPDRVAPPQPAPAPGTAPQIAPEATPAPPPPAPAPERRPRRPEPEPITAPPPPPVPAPQIEVTPLPPPPAPMPVPAPAPPPPPPPPPPPAPMPAPAPPPPPPPPPPPSIERSVDVNPPTSVNDDR